MSVGKVELDLMWVLVCPALVFLMQGGFAALEAGMVRAKNSINVASKNLTDLLVSVLSFWLFGFGLMFGASQSGLFGGSNFLVDWNAGSTATAFFLFHTMFCATAATIISGATAERTSLAGYVTVTMLTAGLIYPVFGHWIWNDEGWLAALGFVDFAGSTAVHSLGGWMALAALLLIGPRLGRFSEDGTPNAIPASNLALSVLGTLLIWLGWFGFNGGSTLTLDESVAAIIANTVLSGAAGAAAATLLGGVLGRGYQDVSSLINGSLAGLVAITASAHAVSSVEAVVIGALGGTAMLGGRALLLRLRIDDAVDAVPVHLVAGAWGTLAVALFGDPALLGTGLPFWEQLWVQLAGIIICGLWALGLGYPLLRLMGHRVRLRVAPAHEQMGLNIAEHHQHNELHVLLRAMDDQARSGDLSGRAPVEPYTEAGQIAEVYNRVMASLEKAVNSTNAIVHSARDAIITFRPRDLAVVSANPAAAQVFHHPSDRFSLTLTELLAHAPTAHRLTELCDGRWRELTGRRADGSTFPLEVNLVHSGHGAEAFITGTFRDVTERREAAAALEQALEAAQEASRAKSAFLANMSHELRTPLNAIIGYSELLLEEAESGEARADLQRIHQAGIHLLGLVSSVLDLSKIEAGKMELHLDAIDIHTLVIEVCDMVRPLVEKSGSQLRLECPERIGEMHADQIKLRQILFNLLSNSGKFTENGQVVLSVRRDERADNAVVVFQVSDTGIGLSAEQLDRLFKEFSQADESTTRKYGGTGLGLAISKRFCEMMQGTITVDSAPGAGSTFTVTLPAQVSLPVALAG